MERRWYSWDCYRSWTAKPRLDSRHCNRQRKRPANRRHVEQQFAGHGRLSAMPIGCWGMSDARTHYLEAAWPWPRQNITSPFEGMLKLRLARLDEGTGTLNDRLALAKRALVIAQSIHDSAGEADAWSLADLHRQLGQQNEAEQADAHALAIYRNREPFVHGVR